jgi:hypothetical protein
MGAPILTVPQAGQVAARPRRENLYDTQGYATGVTTLPFFQNTATWADTTVGAAATSYTAKQFGLDTNLVGNGGSIPRGHYLRVFGMQLYMTRRNATPTTSLQIVEQSRKMIDAGFMVLLLGTTPYLYASIFDIPAGTGLQGPVSTTQTGVCSGSVQSGWPSCTCFRDLTVPGKIKKTVNGVTKEIRVPRIPIEFAETENFAVNLTYPTLPTVTGAIFMVITLVSIYLKPLAG